MNRILSKHIIASHVGLTDDLLKIEYSTHIGDLGILILPPDPSWGGKMDTEPLESLFRKFDELKIPTFRLTFAKYQIIGNSYERYISQTSLCIEEFIRLCSVKSICIIGYSFGALLALNVFLRRPQLYKCIMISPPLLYYDFVSWACERPNSDVLIVSGSKDETAPENVLELYSKFLVGKGLRVKNSQIFGASHYFTGKITQLIEEVLEFIKLENPENFK